MSSDILKKLISVCREFSRHPEWVQGGGGNVSAKIDSTSMLIKASGFAFKDITEKAGLVEVDYNEIKNNYDRLKLVDQGIDYENESLNFIYKHIKMQIGEIFQRPSIETGFHSFLSKYVLHSHSVHANALACSVEGESRCRSLFKGSPFQIIWVPYANPGFNLTLAIASLISGFPQDNSAKGRVFFLQNHGIIVSAESMNICLSVYRWVDEQLKFFLKEKNKYPIPQVKQIGGEYLSATDWIKRYISKNRLSRELFSKVLFPDQVVYLSNNICFCTNHNCQTKVHIQEKEIRYKTNLKQAITIEEILIAYLYIFELQRKNGLQPQFIKRKDVEYINNMESEKYRQDLLKK